MDWEVWRICVDSSIRTIDISLDKMTFLRSMILDYFPSKNSAFSTNWHPLLALFFPFISLFSYFLLTTSSIYIYIIHSLFGKIHAWHKIESRFNQIRQSQFYISKFLGQFRIFENRPLDPVFYFLSKCEKQKTEKLSREIKTHQKC